MIQDRGKIYIDRPQNEWVLGVDFCSKISSRIMVFDLTFADFQTGCQKLPKSDFQSQFSMSKIIHFFHLLVLL